MTSALFTPEDVMTSFDQAADVYHQHTALQREIAHRLLALLPEKEKFSAKSMIDLGAGTGYFTQLMLEHSTCETVIAVDISANMLEQLQQNISEPQRLQTIKASFDAVPLPDQAFDLITSNLAFQWSQNLRTVLNEASRLLAHQGCLLYSTFGEETLKELKQCWGKVDDYVHVNQFETLDQQVTSIEQAGFEMVAVEQAYMIQQYDNAKTLMLNLKGMGAHNVNTGRAKTLTGVGKFKQMLQNYEQFRTAEGVPATFEALMFCLRKK